MGHRRRYARGLLCEKTRSKLQTQRQQKVYAHVCLDGQRGRIQSHSNSTPGKYRLRILYRSLFCDGYDHINKTVHEFNGCWYHGHKCRLTNKTWEKFPKLMTKRQKMTQDKETYLKEQGFKVVKMKECQYQSLPLNKYLPPYYQSHKKALTQDQILKDVVDGKLIGMVKVDIQVPEHLKSYFEEISSIFCTCDVPVSAMGSLMQDHITKYNMSTKPRRLLIGGMKAKKILLLTPLLKWYIDHSLEMTKVYQVIEFSPQASFKEFRESQRSQTQRRHLTRPLVLGDTMKLLGNSAYGSMKPGPGNMGPGNTSKLRICQRKQRYCTESEPAHLQENRRSWRQCCRNRIDEIPPKIKPPYSDWICHLTIR